MASKRVPTREELRGMKRADLQKLAKDHHIKANLKTDDLINELVHARTVHIDSRSGPGPSVIRKERSNATLILDEQENNKPEPQPKLTDSSLSSSGNGSPVRPKPPPAKLAAVAAGPPKLPGTTAAARGAPGVKKVVIPPGVVAADPDAKAKGKAKAPVYVAPVRPVAGSSRPPIVKKVPSGNHKEKMDIAPAPRPIPTVSNLTPPQRTALHSDSSPIMVLTSRIEMLENARKGSQERREAELDLLRSQLRAAQDSISALAKQNDALKARLDSAPAAATQKEMTNALTRLARLEEQFSKLDVENATGKLVDRALSASSSDADHGNAYEPLPLMERSEFQTPPNRYDQGYRTSRVLAPSVIIGNPPRTPPPHIRRYSTNPDDSPSPTRQSSTTSRLLARPPPSSVPTARSSGAFASRGTHRASSVVENGEATLRGSRRVPDSLKRGRRVVSEVVEETDHESDEPSRPPKRHQKSQARSDGGEEEEERSEKTDTSLPYALAPSTLATTPAPHSVERTPGSLHVARGRSVKGGARAHPYTSTPRKIHASVDTDDEAPVQDGRDIFGPTPGPSYVGPLPFADGSIPVLKLGRPSNASTYADLETPMPSPMRREPAEETPPASRTRFGTEFGSTMKTRFSD